MSSKAARVTGGNGALGKDTNHAKLWREPALSSLSSAAYTASYAYDQNNRLTTGPAGTYTYGDTTHLDAVTSASGGYTASYDAAGDMQCRTRLNFGGIPVADKANGTQAKKRKPVELYIRSLTAFVKVKKH